MKYIFRFKEINTQTIIRGIADPSNTISDFVKNMSMHICNELNILFLNNTIEIVEAGHYNNTNGQAPELADKLEIMYDKNATLEEIYGKTWKNTSFYIRIITNV